jgi:nitroimidazol reductase NimA-like FMN-containing flavoprotein (pyridoxamine 5'-phosphate oxidase superfamily)
MKVGLKNDKNIILYLHSAHEGKKIDILKGIIWCVLERTSIKNFSSQKQTPVVVAV